MTKDKKKRKKSPYKAALTVIILVIVLAVFTLFILPQILYAINGEEHNPEDNLAVIDQIVESSENNEETISTEAETSTEAVQFPVLIEDGKLEITSVFQFEGINPDCEKQEGENIAAISLKNLSDTYLDTATVNVILTDGTEHTFLIHDLPTEKSIMAFSVDNLSLPNGYVCADVYAECRFDEIKKDDRIDISVDAASVTLTNITDEDIMNAVVYCHDVWDDKYFGGIAYMYTVDKIPAGESVVITVSDSLMGVIDVVRIAVDN